MRVIDNIDSIETLVTTLLGYGTHYMFRGQASEKWSLETSLERLLGAKYTVGSVTRVERFSMHKFESLYYLYDRENIEPKSELAWMAMMQHYGVPTRMLDFTSSPFTSLYFALENLGYINPDSVAIYAVNYSAHLEASCQYLNKHVILDEKEKLTDVEVSFRSDEIYDEYIKHSDVPIIWISDPKIPNVRLDKQSGTFMLSCSRKNKLKDILSSEVYNDCGFDKIVIPSHLIRKSFELLEKMNISAKTIYGDLGGVAQHIKSHLLYQVTNPDFNVS